MRRDTANRDSQDGNICSLDIVDTLPIATRKEIIDFLKRADAYLAFPKIYPREEWRTKLP